jgi:hypothetical protein
MLEGRKADYYSDLLFQIPYPHFIYENARGRLLVLLIAFDDFIQKLKFSLSFFGSPRVSEYISLLYISFLSIYLWRTSITWFLVIDVLEL